MASNKSKRVLKFLWLLRVEPYLFLFIFFNAIKSVPSDQQIEDKICLQKYKLSHNCCLLLPRIGPKDDYEGKKILDFRRSDKNEFLFTYCNNYTDTFGLIFEIISNKRIDAFKERKNIILL
jgi:hypothetical protein